MRKEQLKTVLKMGNKLQKSLNNPIWTRHKLSNIYQLDDKPDLWKIAYYPIFENGKIKAISGRVLKIEFFKINHHCN